MASTLHRSDHDRFVAGVCGGLADFFGVDATLIRIGFVLFGWFGAGVLVYLVLWVIVPAADAPAGRQPTDVVRDGVADVRRTASRAVASARGALDDRRDDRSA